ncbi:hypothetical protein L226DRAFT_532889 [Lentinus tigrinus ALCF2SS1-7]|uniref:uncharacterized protein n=1 Tax=Lentinus tigrinus ALCF2SS1-7 TaxID=1328758 RepID=UPI001165ECA5|nr:hypothetical protein L226DRAFT_532889 [Lentinus tigrinus ALCF2SS1-7]
MLSLSALSALLATTLSLELVDAHGAHGHGHVHRDVAAAAAPSGTGKYNIPPLSAITSGLPAGATPTLSSTFSAGAKPTAYSNAPALPAKFVFNAGDWPVLDQIPPTDSDQVKEWLKELDGVDIPDIRPTKDGSCDGDPEAAAQAQQNGWWTCGSYTSGNDIVQCPEKNTWGVSFDDGPAPYSPKVLQYLSDHDLTATFFTVGSRVVSYPEILIDEYMAGHEISVHTWSHPPLTSLTNEQLVAEFGWTRHAIQTVLGVTPTTMRPPYGDIDNRVRAVANAMGLRPIIWTTGSQGDFDTNDWRVPAGQHTGQEAFDVFEGILGQAASMDHGFIVLEHDLFEIEVDLSVGYFLDAALTHNPPFKLESIGRCMNIALNNMYQETADAGSAGSNTTTTAAGSNTSKAPSSTGSGGSKAPSSTGSSSSNPSTSASTNSSGGSSSGSGNAAAGLLVPGSAVLGVVAAAVAAVFAGSL